MPLLAQYTYDFTYIWHPLLAVLIFSFVGIVLMFLGYKIFDLLNPRIDFQKELVEKQNMPLAIVLAAVILGIAAITIAAMVT